MKLRLLLLLCALLGTPSIVLAVDAPELTPAESAWVQANPSFRVAGFDLPPYQFEQDGAPAGYQVEVLLEASRRVGLVPEFTWQPLREANRALREGRAEVTLTRMRTKLGAEFLLYSERSFEVQLAIFAPIAAPIRDRAELDGKVIASFRGYQFEETLRALFPSARFVRADSLEGMFRLVAAGEAEACVIELYLGQHQLRANFINGVARTGTLELNGGSPAAASFAVRRGLPILKSILDKGHAAIPYAQHQALRAQWFGAETRPSRPPSMSTTRLLLGVVGGLILLTLLVFGFIRLAGRRLPPGLRDLPSLLGTALLSALMIALMLALSLDLLDRVDRAERKNVGGSLDSLVRTAQGAMRLWFEGEAEQLGALTKPLSLRRLIDTLSGAPAGSPARVEASEALRERLAGRTQIAFFDERGAPIGSNLAPGVATPALSGRALRALPRVFAGQIVFVGPSAGLPAGPGDEMMRILVPVGDGEGKNIAVVVAHYPGAPTLAAVCKLGRPGASGETYAFDRQGGLLTESRFAEQLRRLRLDREGVGLRLSDPGGSLLKGHAPQLPADERPLTHMAARATSGTSGVQTQGYRDYRGVPVLGAWVWDETLGMGFASEIDEAEAMAALPTHRAFVLGSTAGLALLLILLVGTMSSNGRRARRAIQQARDEWARVARERRAALESSEVQFRRLFEDARDAILVAVGGRVVDCNPAAMAMFGYPDKESLCASGIGEHLPAGADEDEPPTLEDVIHSTSNAVEQVWRRADGEAFPAEVQLSPTVYQGAVATELFIRDVSDRKAAEAQSERLWQVVEQSREMVFLIDLKGNIEYANPEFTATTGYASQEVVGTALYRLIGAVNPDQTYHDLWRTVLDGHVWRGELRSRAKDGRVFWQASSFFPVKDGDGALRNLAAIFRDVTEERATRAAVEQARARLDYLLRAIPVTVFTCAPVAPFNATYIGDNIARFGYTPTDLLNDPNFWADRLHPEDASTALAKRGAVLERGRHTHDYRWRAADGSWHWIHEQLVLARDAEGAAVEIIGSWMEITERKAIEASVRLSEARYRAMLTAIPDLVIGLNAEGVITSSNNPRSHDQPRAGVRLSGGAMGQLLPVPAALALQQGIREATASPHEVVLVEYALDFEGPQYFEGRVVASSPDEAVAIIRDVTDWREQEAAISQARQAAEAANQAKSVFLASMSHEIRTPMNAILGYSQLLLRDPRLGPSHREQVSVIHQSASHLLTLINDILETSRVEAGRVTLAIEAVKIRGLLEGVERMFRELAGRKGLELRLKLDESLPQFLLTDPSKVRQVLINLLGNAVKFTERGWVELRARCRPGPSADQEVEIQVADSGPGIRSEDAERIFEAFEQLPNQRRGGTGLGLPISRGFARHMGGDLLLRSERGEGSTFVFTFRAGTGPSHVASVEEGAPRPWVLARSGAKPRLLIVDDTDSTLDLLQRLLGPAGFDLRVAMSGEAAVEQNEAWRPEVILMDLRMPGMGGLEAIRRIRSGSTAPTIIALSTSVLDDPEARVREAGGDGFLPKPIEADALFAHLRALAGFEFQGDPLGTPRPSSFAPSPIPSLAGVPEAMLEALRAAAIAARFDQLSTLITALAEDHPSAAAALKRELDRFRYDALLEALGPEKPESAT